MFPVNRPSHSESLLVALYRLLGGFGLRSEFEKYLKVLYMQI